MDVGAACSGFVYGLATASGLIAAGVAERILVIGAETMYRFMSPDDRGTKVLFGDGAGAVVVRPGTPDEPGAVGPFDLGTDGELADLLNIPAGGSRMPGSSGDIAFRDYFLHMDGKQVYRHAVARMTASAKSVLDKADLTVDDIDHLVAHQANSRIIGAVADRLDVPDEKRFMNLHRYGNTSAASVPLALAEAPLAPGDRVLVTAFGAGLTWASAVLTWPDVVVG